jgi:hypothetical protein
MARSALVALVCTMAAAQQPPTLPVHPEVVLVAAAEPLPGAAFGLGDGGIAKTFDELAWRDTDCVTPGGVVVACRSAGVKLTFPSGRELLLAPDGFLHLRSGERAGPFAAGVELRLGDDSLVRIVLNPSQAERLRDVVVIAGHSILQPWRKGARCREAGRATDWPGQHLYCAGDGGDVFTAVALGPLVVLDRVLVATDRAAATPRERLALVVEPLQESLQRMPRMHQTRDADVRGAVAVVAAVAERRTTTFHAGALLPRLERERMRWGLPDGNELELSLDHAEPRLFLFARQATVPLLEWRFGNSPVAFLTNPKPQQADTSSVHGNGARLLRVADDLQASSERFERAAAVQVLERLRRDAAADARRGSRR